MKRTLFLTLLLMLLIPTAAFAHSKLETAVPAKDSIAEEVPAVISLQYNTKIEDISKFTLTNSAGETIELGDITVSHDTMSSAPAAPLPNDEYTVKWTIVGADGHMVQGDYSFSVNAPAATAAPVQTAEPTASSAASGNTAVQTKQPPVQPTNEPAAESAPEADKASSSTGLYIIGAIIAAAVIVILIIRRRKA